MISFYPGPSRIHDEIPGYVRDAARLGIMSINHRSPEFEKIYRRTSQLLKQKLKIPGSFCVLFTSSATECWEIIAQSLITSRSIHIYNGAFGKKWFEYSGRLRAATSSHYFDRDTALDYSKLKFDEENHIICLTQNETSNGTQVANEIITSIHQQNPSHLVAVDATSSMGGIRLNFEAADVWFASVQKCFGLPAGMGVLILSPRAIQRAKAINERNHYNSMSFMLDMAEKWQTSYTPNVINIYLLMRTLEKSQSITLTHRGLRQRYENWISFLSERTKLRHLISNPSVRSLTVIPFETTEKLVTKIKFECKKNGILLGEGYGELKSTTFRIANFPAIRNADIKLLMKLLSAY